MSDGDSAKPSARRRRLTRQQIVAHALDLGDREGLEAVSLRRIASELGVTSMALYRHVKDKNDLISAMLEAAMAEIDLTVGIEPSLPWQDQVRRLLHNAAEAFGARPVIIPLQVAYQGPITGTVVGPLEDLMRILLDAGFVPEDAVPLARTLMYLLGGLLLLSGPAPSAWPPDALEMARRRGELAVLELPDDQYPVMRRHARLFVETIISQDDAWLGQAIDLLVAGLEAKLRD